MPPNDLHWFDGHLDLAYLAEIGRDMHAEPHDARGRLQPVAVTLPSLRAGRVNACLATVFTEAINPADPTAETGAFAYPAGDINRAYVAGMRQLRLYHAWRQAGLIELMPPRGTAAPAQPPSAAPFPPPLRVGVLVECADPIGSPDELPEWAAGGVVAIGLAWARGSRYAAGNATPPDHDQGLTPAGLDLVRAIDRLNIVHDVSHLSDRALRDLFSATDRPVIASHSNCRALNADPASPASPALQRHLADDTIREIVRRGGVIGLNLYSSFLRVHAMGPLADTARATIAHALAHIEHVCHIAGDRRHIALGSDIDGGFAADRLPVGIDTPPDLSRLADALAARGWSDDDLHAFAHGTWQRFWSGT